MSRFITYSAIGLLALCGAFSSPASANINYDGHFTINVSTGIDDPAGINPAYGTGEAVYFSSANNVALLSVDNTANQLLTYGIQAEIGYYSPSTDRVVLRMKRQANYPTLLNWSPPANGSIMVDGELSHEVEMTIIDPDDYITEDQYSAFSYMECVTSNSVVALDESLRDFRIINPY